MRKKESRHDAGRRVPGEALAAQPALIGRCGASDQAMPMDRTITKLPSAINPTPLRFTIQAATASRHRC